MIICPYNHFSEHPTSRYRETTYKDVSDFKNVTWLVNPVTLPYVRMAHYTVSESEGVADNRSLISHLTGSSPFGMIVGFEKFDLEDMKRNHLACGDFFYLKTHDTYFHPHHRCATAYCGNGWYPSEAIVIKGNFPSFSLKQYTGSARLSLRHMVFQRDNYRCVECGASNKETILNLDHILPVSKGGETIIQNLQTLCRECNLGKSDAIWD